MPYNFRESDPIIFNPSDFVEFLSLLKDIRGKETDKIHGHRNAELICAINLVLKAWEDEVEVEGDSQ